MSKKLLLTAICLLAIPMFVSITDQSETKQAVISPAVSFAGEVVLGTRCDCSAPGCVCPSAQPSATNQSRPKTTAENKAVNQLSAPDDSSLGAIALIAFVLATLVWIRLR